MDNIIGTHLDQIKELIKTNKIKDALKVLEKVVSQIDDEEINSEFLMLSQRFAEFWRSQNKGIIEDENREKNRLLNSLINFLNHIATSTSDIKKEDKSLTVTHIERAEQYYKEAEQSFFKQHQHEFGLELISESIRLRPSFGDAYHLRGVMRLKLERYIEAVHDFGDALERNPTKKDDLFYSLAVCYLRVGQKVNAMNALMSIKNPIKFAQLSDLKVDINKLT